MYHAPTRGFGHITHDSLRAYLEDKAALTEDDLADVINASREAILSFHPASDQQAQRLMLNTSAAEEYNDGSEHRVAYYLQLAHDRDLDPHHPEVLWLGEP